jgi:hypothetical protein
LAKQADEYQIKIGELDDEFKASIETVDAQVKKHKLELESNDLILNELETEIKSLEDQIANH